MRQEHEPGWQRVNEAWAAKTAPPTHLEAEIDQFFERPMDIHVREERLAQRQLEAPQQGAQWLVAFEDFLVKSKQFSLMLEHDPHRAHRQIARHVRKVPFAALSTLVFNRVLHNIVPLLENGEGLCPDPDTRPYSIATPGFPPGELQGNAAAFVRCMLPMLHKGWEETLTNITDPAHHYYPLWECFEAANTVLAWTYKQYHLPSAKEQCYQIAEDNTLVSLELLTHLRLEYAEECAAGSEPSAYGATLKAIRSADNIGWAASGNAKSIGKKIGTDRLADQFPDIEACTGQELLAAFHDRKRLVVPLAEDARFYRYNHRSVAKGPWPIERFCPAVPWLKPPHPEDIAITRRFDDYLTTFRRRFVPDRFKNAPHELDLTLFIRSTLLLRIAALVGHETIFKVWR